MGWFLYNGNIELIWKLFVFLKIKYVRIQFFSENSLIFYITTKFAYKINKTLNSCKFFLIKNFYNIFFSTGNAGSNGKLFLSFQVCSNNMVTKQLLLPNFRACKNQSFNSHKYSQKHIC